MFRARKSSIGVTKCAKNSRETQKGKMESKPTVEFPDTEDEVFAVNAKIHLNNDVHQEVQEFIKRITVKSNPVKDQPDQKLLSVQKSKVKRLLNKSSSTDTLKPCRQAGVAVIITTDFEPNNLSTIDYDRLKQVMYII